MKVERQITAIRFERPGDRDSGIVRVRFDWVWTEAVQTVIEQIKTGMISYFTIDPATGKRAEVGVWSGLSEHLQTEPDGVLLNNLGFLPEF